LYGELTIQPDGYFKPCLQPSENFKIVSDEFINSFHVLDLETKTPQQINFLSLLKVPYIKCPNNKCSYFNEICGLCLVLRYHYRKKQLCIGRV